jgi:beta-glucosidase
VKSFMILNEPGIFTTMGYLIGIHAPGRREPEAFLRATHTVNLAHGDAFRAMRATRGDLSIGTAYSMTHVDPATDSEADAAAVVRWHRFVNEWFLSPALRGVYPDAYPKGTPFELMGVRDGDFERMRAPLDFVGINLYSRSIVKAVDDGGPLSIGVLPVLGQEVGPKTDFGWEVWPEALRQILVRITKDYDRPPIEITENGCSYADGPGADGVVRDARRTEFYRLYLEAVHRAIQEGADVRGYHAWSLLDNFEWAEGYEQRFGITWVEFDDPKRRRILKESGRWYGSVARENTLPG